MTTTSTAPRLDKAAFFADLGYVPHEGQAQVHASRASRRVLACGVRWGKTRCAAMEGLAAAMEPRKQSMGWCLGPTYDLCDKIFRELVVLVAEHLRHRIVTLKENERRIVLRNMAGGLSEIRGKSADNPVSLLGEGLDWVIVDEAARLKPHIWESHISQRLVDRKGWALLISTPRGHGWFYNAFARGGGDDPDYESWNYPSTSNPHLDAKIIEAERARLPQRVFAQEYLGRFVEGAGAVFRGVREAAVGEWQEPVADQRYFAGLDLARVEDFSVLCIVNAKRELVYADRFSRLDWNLQIGRVKTATDRFNRARIVLDATGIGDPLLEAVIAAGCRAEGYTLTQRSKAALIDRLAIAFERREITLPRPELWPEGIAELEGFQYSISDAGNTRSGAPAGMHDDCVLGLAFALWQVPSNPQPPDALVREFRRAFRLT